MSFKLTPITAKIQKTTKGGVTNPFIKGVGVPMKEPAVAKQGGRKGRAASVSKPSIKDTTSKQEILKKEISHMSSAMENYQKKGGEKNASDARYLKKAKDKLAALQGNANKAHLGSKLPFQAPLSGKLKPGEGVLKNPQNSNPVPRAFRQDNKINKSKESEKPQENKFKTIRDKPINRSPEIPKDTRKDTLKDTPKPTKITGKIGSDLRRKQYDAKGWAYDDTIKKPKAKVTNTNKVEKEATIKPTKNVSKKVAKVTKANLRLDKAKSKAEGTSSRKKIRTNKQLTKAAKAVDEGRDKKANRLYKRAARIENREIKKEDRKKARATKRKTGQASKAINPNS